MEYWSRPGTTSYNNTPLGPVQIQVRGGVNGVAPVPAAILLLVSPQGPASETVNSGGSNTLVTALFAQEQWTLKRLTLNLGVRYEYDHNTPNTKYGFAPRLGAAFAPNSRTAFRAGFGTFYEFPATSIISSLYSGRVISTVFAFDTGEDTSATRGVRPANTCLLPQGRDGFAVISAACRAQLVANQNQLTAGGFVNTEPRLPGNRKLGYLYQINVGFEREIIPAALDAGVRIVNYGNTRKVANRQLSQGEGGLSGPDIFPTTLENLRRTRRVFGNDLEIIATGGVDSADKAAKLLDEGATAVGFFTGFVTRGPILPRLILERLVARR